MRDFLAILAFAVFPAASWSSTLFLDTTMPIPTDSFECASGETIEPAPRLIDVLFSSKPSVSQLKTCLPEPCARALTRQELADLIGTAVSDMRFDEKWGEYYARYADHCRKETVGPVKGSYRQYLTNGFWSPLLSVPSYPPSQLTGVEPTSLPSGTGSNYNRTPDPRSQAAVPRAFQLGLGPVVFGSNGSAKSDGMAVADTGPDDGDADGQTTTLANLDESEIGQTGDLRPDLPSVLDGETHARPDRDDTNQLSSGSAGTSDDGINAAGAGEDLTPVPLPAGWLLLGTALVVLSRKKATRLL